MRDIDSAAEIVQAIRELTRVTIALHGEFDSQAAAVRELNGVGISKRSIAAILDMETKNVSSILNQARKRASRQE